MSQSLKQYIQRKYTVEQVLDYMECPLCYHLKHEKKIPLKEDFLADNKNIAYQEAMFETMRYFYIEHQKKKPPTYKNLCDRFYRSWLEKTDSLDTMSILTRKLKNATRDAREEQSRYIKEGYKGLENFYSYNSSGKQAVLAVNHPYTIRLKSIEIEGKFHLVREIYNPQSKLREIQLIVFHLGKQLHTEETLKTDLNLLSMGLGFKEIFGVHPDRFILYYPSKGESVEISHKMSDYKKAIHIFNAFRLSVENIPRYPRPGAHKTISPYKKYCDNYEF